MSPANVLREYTFKIRKAQFHSPDRVSSPAQLDHWMNVTEKLSETNITSFASLNDNEHDHLYGSWYNNQQGKSFDDWLTMDYSNKASR
ncbi:MAG TPA: hypothetical protein VJZ75_07580 [Candidatus Bathyarchaeia archaeon]|nr:hypothetical protein [Candidatus Bathyarchaeia archaeon]